MREKFTPEKITSLNENEVFVFGSNLQGEHVGGAAYVALKNFGAEFGNGVGLQGNSYAIPTCGRMSIGDKRYTFPFKSVGDIKPYVDKFIADATENTDKVFYVTKIGCGIAGFKVEDIAELFRGCLDMENVVLPKEFVELLS